MDATMTIHGSELEGKRVFLIACADAERRQKFSTLLQKKLSHTRIFQALDGSEALFKIDNSPPHVLIIDPVLPKLSGYDVVRQVLDRKQTHHELAIIIAGPQPEEEMFVEAIVNGTVHFLSACEDEVKFDICVTQALNHLTHTNPAEYTLHFLAPGEFLFKEGDVAKHVFIVKRGRLKAVTGDFPKEVTLGEIGAGEFVGEMAHINNEPRSASVQALDDCELIEIPNGALDMVLFSRPKWAQALVTTLAKRLKSSNQALAQRGN